MGTFIHNIDSIFILNMLGIGCALRYFYFCSLIIPVSVVKTLAPLTIYIPEFGCADNHLMQEAARLDSVFELMPQ